MDLRHPQHDTEKNHTVAWWVEYYHHLKGQGITLVPLYGYKSQSSSYKRPQCRWRDFTIEDDLSALFLPGITGGAILTGSRSSNLFVVDVDYKKNGNQDALKLFEELGYPETRFVVDTPSGAHHYYIYASEKGGTGRNRAKEGLDVRGEGGLIVCPYSRHHTGGMYTLMVNEQVLRIPELSKDDIDKLYAQDDGSYFSYSPSEHKADAYLIQEGERDDRLYKLCVSLVARENPDFDDLLAFAITQNEKRCRPPMSDEEVYTKAKSAFENRIEIVVDEIEESADEPEKVSLPVLETSDVIAEITRYITLRNNRVSVEAAQAFILPYIAHAFCHTWSNIGGAKVYPNIASIICSGSGTGKTTITNMLEGILEESEHVGIEPMPGSPQQLEQSIIDMKHALFVMDEAKDLLSCATKRSNEQVNRLLAVIKDSYSKSGQTFKRRKVLCRKEDKFMVADPVVSYILMSPGSLLPTLGSEAFEGGFLARSFIYDLDMSPIRDDHNPLTTLDPTIKGCLAVQYGREFDPERGRSREIVKIPVTEGAVSMLKEYDVDCYKHNYKNRKELDEAEKAVIARNSEKAYKLALLLASAQIDIGKRVITEEIAEEAVNYVRAICKNALHSMDNSFTPESHVSVRKKIKRIIGFGKTYGCKQGTLLRNKELARLGMNLRMFDDCIKYLISSGEVMHYKSGGQDTYILPKYKESKK